VRARRGVDHRDREDDRSGNALWPQSVSHTVGPYKRSVCTLPADARVADFLRYWVDSLARRGMRTDQITLRMTRAEIGNYLGMTLESVSRALSHLARCSLIEFVEKGRR